MPYPAAHSLLTFSGPAYRDQDEWSTGLRLARTTPPSMADLEAADAAFYSFVGSEYIGGNNACLLMSTKWAPQTTEGLYGSGSSVEYLRPTPSELGATTAPPQICFVISLRTARPRGYGSNGRMYIPAAPPLENDQRGQILVGRRDFINTAAQNFLTAITVAMDTEIVVGSKVGSGLLEPVTGVRCGRVLDTQRRRRAGIPEDYSATLPVPS